MHVVPVVQQAAALPAALRALAGDAMAGRAIRPASSDRREGARRDGAARRGWPVRSAPTARSARGRVGAGSRRRSRAASRQRGDLRCRQPQPAVARPPRAHTRAGGAMRDPVRRAGAIAQPCSPRRGNGRAIFAPVRPLAPAAAAQELELAAVRVVVELLPGSCWPPLANTREAVPPTPSSRPR